MTAKATRTKNEQAKQDVTALLRARPGAGPEEAEVLVRSTEPSPGARHDAGAPGLEDHAGGRRCRYCGRPHPVSAWVAEESPWCAACLHERVALRAAAEADNIRIDYRQLELRMLESKLERSCKKATEEGYRITTTQFWGYMDCYCPLGAFLKYQHPDRCSQHFPSSMRAAQEDDILQQVGWERLDFFIQGYDISDYEYIDAGVRELYEEGSVEFELYQMGRRFRVKYVEEAEKKKEDESGA